MNIYLGNLASDVTENDLKEAFDPFGQTTSISIIKDKFTQEPRGFAFVEMPSDEAAKAAIAALDGKELKGKAIKVNEARSKKEGGGGGGRGNRFNRGGGNRYQRN